MYVIVAGGRDTSDIAAITGVQELTTTPSAPVAGATAEERVFVIRRDLKKD